MPKRGKGPDGYQREPVPVLDKIQAWQPTPDQQRDLALGAATSMAIYVIGKVFTSPFGLG
ncbi:hypothetical protein ACFU9Y_01065 [Streptomyces sp. NPDC057621]|uniref:hypothetical protein n=1 Tax=Streptomyces sp. NPDC057621 TaxID=3346186 RepID=UPI0036CA20E8